MTEWIQNFTVGYTNGYEKAVLVLDQQRKKQEAKVIW